MKKLLLIILLSLFSFSTFASESVDPKIISSIEESLNSFKNATGNFTQYDSDGNSLTGEFWLSKPGKMRFNYDNDNYIVSNGSFVFYWDNELEQQTNAPLSYTPASILLNEDIKLTDDIVVNKIKNEDIKLSITLASKENEDWGSLTLNFTKNNDKLTLVSWKISNLNNYDTIVLLRDVKFNVENIDKKLFRFKDPTKNPFKLN